MIFWENNVGDLDAHWRPSWIHTRSFIGGWCMEELKWFSTTGCRVPVCVILQGSDCLSHNAESSLFSFIREASPFFAQVCFITWWGWQKIHHFIRCFFTKGNFLTEKLKFFAVGFFFWRQPLQSQSFASHCSAELMGTEHRWVTNSFIRIPT